MANITKSYTVKSPVNHDDKRYEIDDTIELDAKHAKPLIACGAIEDAKAEKKAEPAK